MKIDSSDPWGQSKPNSQGYTCITALCLEPRFIFTALYQLRSRSRSRFLKEAQMVHFLVNGTDEDLDTIL